MKIEELKGKNILKAYDCDYLSDNFGYSCANINVPDTFTGYKSNQGNKMQMFDIFIDNPNNISCYVYIGDDDKIKGRRMFFKGKSLLNDKEFNIPTKMGSVAKYMYGYYGERIEGVYRSLTNYIVKNNPGILYTDRFVIDNGRMNTEINNYFILQIEKADYKIYPPIDYLYICPEIKAFANFNPSEYNNVLNVLERDLGVDDIEFGAAYRYSKDALKSHGISTWVGLYPEEEEEEEDEENIEVGDIVKAVNFSNIPPDFEEYLKSSETFEVLRTNQRGFIDVGFEKEEDGKTYRYFLNPRRFEKVKKTI